VSLTQKGKSHSIIFFFSSQALGPSVSALHDPISATSAVEQGRSAAEAAQAHELEIEVIVQVIT
jgi:hypothetical protein